MIQQISMLEKRSRTLLSTVYYLPSFCIYFLSSVSRASLSSAWRNMVLWLNHKILFIYLSELAFMQYKVEVNRVYMCERES